MTQAQQRRLHAKQHSADARLIDAAPDLLDALRNCLMIIGDGPLTWRHRGPTGEKLEAIRAIVIAAIAKAEGNL